MQRHFLKAWLKNNKKGITTIEQLADAIETSRPFLSDFINGKTNGSSDVLLALSKVTGHSMEELMLGDNFVYFKGKGERK